MFRTVHRNGYMVEQTTKGAISPSTGRTLPDRYIEGTCPICGYDEARGDQCDNCGNQLDPTDLIDPRSKINGEVPEFVETQHFFLDLPALADALEGVARRARGVRDLAAERHQVQPEHPRGHPAAGDDPRHRLGHPGAARGLARTTRPSGSTSGSTRSSATCRRRSSGPAASASPDRWREWWNDPEALSYYFMGKDNITFHSQIWPAELLAYDGRGDRGGEPGEYGALNLPTEVVSSGVPHDGGQAVLVLAGRGDLRPRRARALPARRAALLHLRGRAGEPGQQLHLGGVRAAHQRRAGRRLGQPGQPDRDDDRQELRRDPGGRRPRADDDQALLDTVEAAFGDGRRADRAAPAEGGARPRRCAPSPRSTSTSPTARRGSSRATTSASGSARSCTSPRRPSPTATCCSRRSCRTAPNAVDLVLGGAGDVAPMPEIREVEDLDGGPAYPILTGDYSGFPAWERRPVVPGTRSRSRRRCSPSSTRRWSTRSWPGSRSDGVTLHPQAVAALELWSQGPSVADPGFGPADIAAMRAEALAAAAAWSRRSRSTGSRTSTPTACRCRLYVPDGRAAHDRCSCTAAASCSATSTPTTARRAGSPTGPARRCSRSTTGGRPSTGSRRPPTTWTPRCAGCSCNAAGRGLDLGPGGRARRQRRRQPRAGRGAAQPERAGRGRAGLPVRRRGDGAAVVRRAGRRADPRRGGLVLGAVRRAARGPRSTPTWRRTSPTGFDDAAADAGAGRRARRARRRGPRAGAPDRGRRARRSRTRRTPG